VKSPAGLRLSAHAARLIETAKDVLDSGKSVDDDLEVVIKESKKVGTTDAAKEVETSLEF
jgi:hypothetical protein